MHEFSIVQNIIEIALGAAIQNQVDGIRCVEVEIGQVSGIVPEAMEFAWESARKDTILQEASLQIRIVPLQVRCRDCGCVFHPDDLYKVCPSCGAYHPEVISGRELRVTAIQV